MNRWLKKHFFEKEILCNINAFTVTFDKINASLHLLNNMINYLKKMTNFKLNSMLVYS